MERCDSLSTRRLTTELVLGGFYRFCVDWLYWFRTVQLYVLKARRGVRLVLRKRSHVLVQSVLFAKGIAEDRHVKEKAGSIVVWENGDCRRYVWLVVLLKQEVTFSCVVEDTVL